MKTLKLEKIEMLTEAQRKLFEVVNMLEEVFDDDVNIQTYLIDPLKTLTSNGHGFLTNDLNIDKVIQSIKKEEW